MVLIQPFKTNHQLQRQKREDIDQYREPVTPSTQKPYKTTSFFISRYLTFPLFMLVTSPSDDAKDSIKQRHHKTNPRKNKAGKIKNMSHEPHRSLNWAHQKESCGFAAACWLSRSAPNSHYQGLQPWPSKRCYRQCCGLGGCLVAMLSSCLRT